MVLNKKIIPLALCICMIVPMFALFVSADGPQNLFDKNAVGVIKGGYISSGKKNTNPSYSSTDFISVKAKSKVYAGIIATDIPKGIPVFEFYDSSKKYLSKLNSSEVSFDKYSKKAAIASADIPENAEFVRVNLLGDNLDKFFVTADEELTVDSYYALTGDEKPYVRFDSPLYGKKILFCGDSICDASVEKNDPRYSAIAGWAGRIGTYNDMDWLNKGTSGASISDKRGINTVYEQLKSQSLQSSSYDIVLLHGGVNDGWDNVTVGEKTDSFNSEDFNLSTFAGGLEYTFWYAKTKYKNAKIGYIINAGTPAAWGSLSNMSKYYDLAKEICDKWEIPYVDLYNDEVLKNTNIPTCNDDKIHPTHEGYEILYPYIEKFTESLVAPDAPVTILPSETPDPTMTEAPVTIVTDQTAKPTTKPTTKPTAETTAKPTVEPQVTQVEKSEGGVTIVYIVIGAIVVLAIAGTSAAILISKKKKVKK